VDLIRGGKAPEVIRRKGAEGILPLPAQEAIEVLTLLAASPEADLREKALETFHRWDRYELERVLADPQTPSEVLHFAAQQALAGREELKRMVLLNPSLPADLHDVLRPGGGARTDNAEPQPGAETDPTSDEAGIRLLAKLASGVRVRDADTPAEAVKPDDELTAEERQTLIQKVSRMTVVEKIKAALTGNLETRSLLIRDSNKIVARAVLQSPKISETEAEGYAGAKNVSEEVLRQVSMNRRFMKSYVVVRALANNPRAPIDVTLPLVNRLNDRDLKGLALNRNVPDVIRGLAAKAIRQKEDALRNKHVGKH